MVKQICSYAECYVKMISKVKKELLNESTITNDLLFVSKKIEEVFDKNTKNYFFLKSLCSNILNNFSDVISKQLCMDINTNLKSFKSIIFHQNINFNQDNYQLLELIIPYVKKYNKILDNLSGNGIKKKDINLSLKEMPKFILYDRND